MPRHCTAPTVFQLCNEDGPRCRVSAWFAGTAFERNRFEEKLMAIGPSPRRLRMDCPPAGPEC
jgi:hypothetical protein